MIRHCNGTDPNLRTKDGTTGNCGAIFDDVNHWTTCPHDEFPINRAVRALLSDAHDRMIAVKEAADETLAAARDAAVAAVDAHFLDQAPHITGVHNDPSVSINVAPHWTGPNAEGRYFPPAADVRNDIGAARILVGPPHAHRDGPCGPECYVAPSAALGGDTIPIVPGEPAATDPGGAEAGSDTERIAAATARYMTAAHAMHSGVAQLLYFNDTDAQPKHVRVGINLSKVTEGVLVKVLIDMGIITHAEWAEALAQGVEDEVRRYEADLTEMMGARVRLL